MIFLCSLCASYIVSFSIKKIHELKILKDIADNAYKVDLKSLGKIEKILNSGAPKITFFSYLIPFYNIAKVIRRINYYNSNKSIILSQLDGIEYISEMNNFEKIEYLKNGSIINAINISLNSKKNLESADSVKIETDSLNSEIFYKKGKDKNDITILKTDGPVNQLTMSEQRRIIEDAFNYNQEIDRIDSNNFATILKEKKYTIKNKHLEKKHKLENFRDMLLNLNKEKQPILVNDEKVYSKRKNIK